MPAKTKRKTLGNPFAPSVTALRALIDTQSKDTIRAWCLAYAEDRLLPFFETLCPGDARPRRALCAARDYLAGKTTFTAVKQIILNECHAAARELAGHPAAQAAARAIGQGASVVHTPTHALGLYFYTSAAFAYHRLGLDASDAAYEQVAEEICAEYTDALRSIALENEPNPVKIKWNC
jgi:hypothetical protein